MGRPEGAVAFFAVLPKASKDVYLAPLEGGENTIGNSLSEPPVQVGLRSAVAPIDAAAMLHVDADAGSFILVQAKGKDEDIVLIDAGVAKPKKKGIPVLLKMGDVAEMWGVRCELLPVDRWDEHVRQLEKSGVHIAERTRDGEDGPEASSIVEVSTGLAGDENSVEGNEATQVVNDDDDDPDTGKNVNENENEEEDVSMQATFIYDGSTTPTDDEALDCEAPEARVTLTPTQKVRNSVSSSISTALPRTALVATEKVATPAGDAARSGGEQLVLTERKPSKDGTGKQDDGDESGNESVDLLMGEEGDEEEGVGAAETETEAEGGTGQGGDHVGDDDAEEEEAKTMMPPIGPTMMVDSEDEVEEDEEQQHARALPGPTMLVESEESEGEQDQHDEAPNADGRSGQAISEQAAPSPTLKVDSDKEEEPEDSGQTEEAKEAAAQDPNSAEEFLERISGLKDAAVENQLSQRKIVIEGDPDVNRMALAKALSADKRASAFFNSPVPDVVRWANKGRSLDGGASTGADLRIAGDGGTQDREFIRSNVDWIEAGRAAESAESAGQVKPGPTPGVACDEDVVPEDEDLLASDEDLLASEDEEEIVEPAEQKKEVDVKPAEEDDEDKESVRPAKEDDVEAEPEPASKDAGAEPAPEDAPASAAADKDKGAPVEETDSEKATPDDEHGPSNDKDNDVAVARPTRSSRRKRKNPSVNSTGTGTDEVAAAEALASGLIREPSLRSKRPCRAAKRGAPEPKKEQGRQGSSSSTPRSSKRVGPKSQVSPSAGSPTPQRAAASHANKVMVTGLSTEARAKAMRKKLREHNLELLPDDARVTEADYVLVDDYSYISRTKKFLAALALPGADTGNRAPRIVSLRWLMQADKGGALPSTDGWAPKGKFNEGGKVDMETSLARRALASKPVLMDTLVYFAKGAKKAAEGLAEAFANAGCVRARSAAAADVVIATEADVPKLAKDGVQVPVYTMAWFTKGLCEQYTLHVGEAADKVYELDLGKAKKPQQKEKKPKRNKAATAAPNTAKRKKRGAEVESEEQTRSKRPRRSRR